MTYYKFYITLVFCIYKGDPDFHFHHLIVTPFIRRKSYYFK